MEAKAIDPEEIRQKLEEYSSFLREVLRPDSEALSAAENEARMEIEEYKELRERLTDWNSVDPHLVDLGSNKVQCRATVDDSSTIFVNVGMGFHVELTVDEALAYVDKRIHFLSSQVLKHRSEKSRQVQEHIQSSTMILEELSRELERNRR